MFAKFLELTLTDWMNGSTFQLTNFTGRIRSGIALFSDGVCTDLGRSILRSFAKRKRNVYRQSQKILWRCWLVPRFLQDWKCF